MTNAMRPWPSPACLITIGAAWLAAGCATAPPAQPPALTSEQKLAAIIRLEHQRVLQAPEERSSKPPCRRRVSGRAADAQAGDLLHDADDRVRRRAAIAIGRAGSIAGVASLVPALEDSHPSVRQMVAFALGLIGGVEATEPLLRALTDPDPLTSGWAPWAWPGWVRLRLLQRSAPWSPPRRFGVDIETDDLTYPQASEAEAFRMGVTPWRC